MQFVREEIRRMKAYEPGKSEDYVKRKYGLSRVVKLASNENPYGVSPKAIESLRKFNSELLSKYPETFPPQLLEAIESYIGWPKDMVVVGAGLDGVLETIFRLFINRGDSVLLPIPTYPYYHTVIQVFGAKGVFVERNEEFRIDVDRIITTAKREKPKLIIVCSPNNPTGLAEREEDVRALIESCNCPVFIDEAYGEFADYDGVSLKHLFDYENVIIGRTMSKAFGLANLRIGYAVMSEELRKEYLKATTPFPVSTLSANAAAKALEDKEFLHYVLKKNAEERERLIKELGKYFKVYRSNANFVFADVGNAPEFVESLMKMGVIVRDCSKFYGCCRGHVRITVGRKEENDLLISAVSKLR